jgi:hypothetical protein
MTSTSKRSQFLDPAKALAAIKEVAELANKAGVRVALAGGNAMQLYGSDRLTADVDVVSAEILMSLPRLGALTFGGTKSKASNGVPVDVIVRTDDRAALYDEALDHAQQLPGIPIPVITLPYLGTMKLAAHRGKDLQDLNFILVKTNVNYKKLREVVVKHLGEDAADDLDAYQLAAAWEHKK